MNQTSEQNQQNNEKETDISRRKALQKLGVYAYSAPVILSLLASKKASAASHFSPPLPPGF